MKSYFLDKLDSEISARDALSEILPHWVEPWLLKDGDDDVVAYFSVNRNSQGEVSIQADLSGRHHGEDSVLHILAALKKRLGGFVTDDNDNVI